MHRRGGNDQRWIAVRRPDDDVATFTLGLPRWLSYLIVWVLFLIVAAILALLGRSQLRKIEKPERTIKTTRDTASWARHPTSPAP